MADVENVEGCIFCSAALGKTPVDVVHDGEDVLFFRDISPKARVHILGIPKKHIESLSKVTEEDRELVASLMSCAVTVARGQGLLDGGYRVVINDGPDAGQEVQHLHIHILGGERLGPLQC